MSGGSRITPAGGGASTPQRGDPTYNFVKFSQKLHEIQKILVSRGAHTLQPPKSATGDCRKLVCNLYIQF